MKLLIATGIYPPQIGGPAQYAKEVAEAWRRKGHHVRVRTFGVIERHLPTGLRHIWFFFRVLPSVIWSDGILVLDTFSVGLPTIALARLFGRRAVIRTGGDFLWESYVERTGDMVLFRNFYTAGQKNWNKKERMIFNVTRWTLARASLLIFSTTWQRDIFIPAYGLNPARTRIVENFYGPKVSSANLTDAAEKVFVAGTRKLIWKNLDMLNRAFAAVATKHPNEKLTLDMANAPFEAFLTKIERAYAVVLVSIGDISPNMILDAIRLGTPCVCTRETGLYERLNAVGIGIFVDPKDEQSIERGIQQLLDPTIYATQKERIRVFDFVHTWDDIGREIAAIITQ